MAEFLKSPSPDIVVRIGFSDDDSSDKADERKKQLVSNNFISLSIYLLFSRLLFVYLCQLANYYK